MNFEQQQQCSQWHAQSAFALDVERDVMRLIVQDELQETQWLFHAMFEQAAVGIAYVMLDGRLLHVNQRFCAIVGYTAEELLHRSFLSLTHPDDVDTNLLALQQMRANERQTYTTEKRYVRKDGSTIWIHLTSSAVYDNEGKLCCFLSILEDISARKQAEEERTQLLLREQAARAEALAHARQLETIFEAMTDAVFFHDTKGHIIQTNAAGRELLPLQTQPDYYTQPFEERIVMLQPRDEDGAPLPKEKWPITRMLQGEVLKGNNAVDMVMEMPDGSERHFSLSGAPMQNPEGHIIGVLSLLRDVTERRHMEKALRAANQHMDAFLSIVSHELKSPLTAIKGNIQLAAHRLMFTTEHKDELVMRKHNPFELIINWLEIADQQVSTLDRLVGDLLDISRIQVDKMKVDLAPCDLLEIVRAAIEMQQTAHPGRAILLQAEGEEELDIFADEGRIGQVVTNYLSNAIKYASKDKPIKVIVEKRAEQVYVAVQDEGPGLSAEQHQRIWQRFYQVASVKEQGGTITGLGLGLHISKMIIDLHQGQVGVTSVPRQGATFWFTLPLSETLATTSPWLDNYGIM